MAGAAYAAVVSLMNTMEQIQNHPRHSISFDKKQIEALQEKLGFLQDFLEGYSRGSSKEAEVLESQIASAAHTAEDVIESHVVRQILAGSTEKSSISLLDLQKAIEDMDAINEKVMKVKEERGLKSQQPTHSTTPASSRLLTTGKSTMVGFDNYLIKLMDILTGQQSSRQIIPIVGMGGIGKTTLARNVYENLVIVQHFDIRAWATVSQEYNVREILAKLLSCLLRKSTNEIDGETNDELGEKLYKCLYGRRYLIILDDMWNIEAWDKIKFFFPDDDNGSGIIITTRLSNMAIHFASSDLKVDFLDEDKSWNLFCEKAFGQEGCPPELEKIGKKIAKKCKGLPLSIVVIGGLLRKSSGTQEYWESIANDINSILNSSEGKQCFNILSLSYNQLPVHLKPCFLYMGFFSEDREIRVSQLIKLWVAEGFLKLKYGESLEEVAEGYLQDLIDRNLILIGRLGSSGKIKTCNIHDLLRDLCLRVAEKEKFLSVMGRDIRRIDQERRIVFHGSIPERYWFQVFYCLKSLSRARSLICYGGGVSFKLKLLRILDGVDDNTLETIFQLVNLRYVACDVHSRYPRLIPDSSSPWSISALWNVQTLIIRGRYDRIVAPSEIWHMPQLRHIQIYDCYLFDPPSDRIDQQDDFVMRNLQTLLKIRNFKLSEEVCKRIPNVKKLHVIYDQEFTRPYDCCLHNLGLLHKLESLNCLFHGVPNRLGVLENLTFPSSLKKLILGNCHSHWEDLTMIGSLPHLEVLKLGKNLVIGPEWVTGPEWNPVEGEFLHLKFLEIKYCYYLTYWNADSCHFPVLEQLVLKGLRRLDKIPSGIGDIPTLRIIRLHYCNMSTTISAMKILEEQESLGNEGLQLEVRFWYEKDVKSFREKVEAEGITSNNLHLSPARSP